jgi:hypothetical protein
MKLYQLRIRGGYSSTSTNYRESYVVASSIDGAYMQVREYLDRNDLCFQDERELESITLIAEMSKYPACKTMLFIEGLNQCLRE